MSKFTVITLKAEENCISLHTEDQTYHISGAFRINAAMLKDFIEDKGEALYDFDMDFALRMYRIADASVSLHLTWLNDVDAYAQSCILPVSFIRRVLAGKTVNAVVENHFSYYDTRTAREHLFMKVSCM